MYVKGRNYCINIVILIEESGIYWILCNSESGIYIKVIATTDFEKRIKIFIVKINCNNHQFVIKCKT